MVSCVFTNVIIVSTARLAFPGQCPIRVIFRASVRSAIGSGDPARPGRPRAYVIAVQHAEHGTRRRRRRLLRLSQWLLSGLRVSRRPRPGPRGPGPFSPAPPALHRDCLSWWLRESSQLAPRPALPRLRAGGGVMVRPAAGRIGEWTGLDPSACFGVSLFGHEIVGYKGHGLVRERVLHLR